MHSPNYKKAVCLFYKPVFNFISAIYCRCNCFYSVGGGGVLGFVGFNFAVLNDLLQKLMKTFNI